MKTVWNIIIVHDSFAEGSGASCSRLADDVNL